MRRAPRARRASGGPLTCAHAKRGRRRPRRAAAAALWDGPTRVAPDARREAPADRLPGREPAEGEPRARDDIRPQLIARRAAGPEADRPFLVEIGGRTLTYAGAHREG